MRAILQGVAAHVIGSFAVVVPDPELGITPFAVTDPQPKPPWPRGITFAPTPREAGHLDVTQEDHLGPSYTGPTVIG